MSQNNIFDIFTDNKKYSSKYVILASGSKAMAKLGSSDSAYKFAQNFGHNIIKTNPALVGFTVQKEQFWFKTLSGLSVKAKIKISNKTFL